MFTSTSLFKHILCPNSEQCRLTNCIFSHEAPVQPDKTSPATIVDHGRLSTIAPQARVSPPPTKRRRVEDASAPSHKERAEPPTLKLPPDRAVRLEPTKSVETKARPGISPKSGTTSIQSTTKPVSPPPSTVRGKPSASKDKSATANGKSETLNPRMIPHDPAGHGKRTVYLKALHNELQRLNESVDKDSDDRVKSLHQDGSKLIRLCLDEEEKVAREQPSVYANIMKLKIVKYRKMVLAEWIEERRKAAREKGKAEGKGIIVETGLTATEEVRMLRRMAVDQEGLDQWGYVTSPPTEDSIKAAWAGVSASGGYEECDRCKTRFQVFPDRRADGALTSGGKCIYHWGRPFFPKRQKTDAIKGPPEPRYSCCNEVLGTSGCTEDATHVYKITEAKRLAAVLPFETTPSDVNEVAFDAVCFDCEMGYTVYGLELIRLTAVSWPEGHALLDVLVRPLGAILDLNTRFSGVTQAQMANSETLDEAAWREKLVSIKRRTAHDDVDEGLGKLHIVSSPVIARRLLTSLLDHNTLLVGHALENDLNAVRLVHPHIVDTVFLFPHARGLPYRYGLRQLALQYLERHIQTAGTAGHSSLEDASATGDVARWKVKLEWDKLRLEGWTVKNGAFYKPGTVHLASGEVGSAPAPVDLPIYLSPNPKKSRDKRKRSGGAAQLDGADEANEADNG